MYVFVLEVVEVCHFVNVCTSNGYVSRWRILRLGFANPQVHHRRAAVVLVYVFRLCCALRVGHRYDVLACIPIRQARTSS